MTSRHVVTALSLAILSSTSSFAVEYASVLGSGQSMRSGDSVLSGQGRSQLFFQNDNNFVLYQVGEPYVPTWDYLEGTLNGEAHPGYGPPSGYPLQYPTYPALGYAHADMQADGNLVIISAKGILQWASGTEGYPGADLNVGDDNRLVITYLGKSIWSSNTDDLPILQTPFPAFTQPIFGNALRSVLLPGETLQEGGFLASDGYPYGNYYITILQNDGNLVQYDVEGGTQTPLWSTLTGLLDSIGNYPANLGPANPSAHGNRLVMNQDGDCQLIDDSQARVAWDSGTSGSQGCYLDGNYEIDLEYLSVRHQQLPLWSSQDTNDAPYRLSGNHQMFMGDYLRRVVNQTEYTVILQTDGNLVFYSRALASNTYTALWSTITGPIGIASRYASIYRQAAIGDVVALGNGPVLANEAGFPQAVTWVLPLSLNAYATHMEISDQGVLVVIDDRSGAIVWKYTD